MSSFGEVSVRIRWIAEAVVIVLAAAPMFAQVATTSTEAPLRLPFNQIGLFVYPAKGQKAAQQRKDEQACYDWAEVNTGMTLVPGEVDTRAAGRAAAQVRDRARSWEARRRAPQPVLRSAPSAGTLAGAPPSARSLALSVACVDDAAAGARTDSRALNKRSRRINRPSSNSGRRRGPVFKRAVTPSVELGGLNETHPGPCQSSPVRCRPGERPVGRSSQRRRVALVPEPDRQRSWVGRWRRRVCAEESQEGLGACRRVQLVHC